VKNSHAMTTVSQAVALALLCGVPAFASAADQPATQGELEEVTVTGFRFSLRESADAKRESTGFTDSIFAEDIGKFPDTNIAESLTRIPGIQIQRDVNGEGVNINIRGLGNSFTKTIINGVQVATASIGLNATNQNREVDLNLFPTEFFNQLQVYKSPLASLPEGGAAGVINMRNARPFDNPGTHVNFSVEGGWNSISDKLSPQASALGSWTNDEGTMGALVGLSTVQGHIGVEGFETVGWTNPGLNYTQCGAAVPVTTPATNPLTTRPASCNTGGGGNWLIPDTVPNNSVSTAAGLTPNAPIDAAFLTSHNSGLSIAQISEALMPRLGRPVNMSGQRDRNSVLGSIEWRPSDKMHFYLDTLYSQAKRNNDRIDINLVGRVFGASGMIPLNMKLDSNNVVTSATMTNAQYFLEARPYREDVKYVHFDPGATFLFGADDSIKLDVKAYKSRSWMFRESPTILVNSPFTTISYANDGTIPTWDTTIDLNNPNAGWTWAGGRVNVQNERRHTRTSGFQGDLQFGDEKNNVKVGAALDKNFRRIQGFDNSAAWQTYVLSQIPDSALPTYLKPGPLGFITADFEAFMDRTNYEQYRDSAPESGGPNTGGSTGAFSEKTKSAYVELNATADVWNRPLRMTAGVRYATTDQAISGPVTLGGVRRWQTIDGDYDEVLPSFGAAWDVAPDIVLRLSGSRTMTRPNPSSMLPNTTFTDTTAQVASQGNPDLAPYISNNIDLGGEWYTGGEGFVGLTLFQKRVQGYTFQGTTTRVFSSLGIPVTDLTANQLGAITARGGPDVATVTVNQQVNADGLVKIRGIEGIWVQPLDLVFKGLGVMANYTDLNIKTDGKDGSALVSNVFGIAPKLLNATGYWEDRGASIRLSYSWRDSYAATGPNQNSIPVAQIIAVKRFQWDLAASYKFDEVALKPQITLNVLNLSNEKLRSNFWYSNAVNDVYNPGRTITLGIRGTF